MSSTSSTIVYEARDQIAWIRLNRPEAMNAINPEMLDALNEAIDRYRDDRALKAAVISGEGTRAFSAGVDLKSYAARLAAGESSQQTMNIIRFAEPGYCPKPVIASVRGWCVGMGLHLALACDFRVCADDAKFFTPETAHGISLTRLSWQLVRTMGLPAALEFGLLAEKKDAQWALANRLVHRVAPAGEELAEAEKIARRLCEVNLPAVQATRTTMYKAFDLTYAENYEFSMALRNAVLDQGQDRVSAEAFAARVKPA
ncbi:MAG: enoyl-CoA hydratase/isomerase family protein [Pseudomonadota bacterium]